MQTARIWLEAGERVQFTSTHEANQALEVIATLERIRYADAFDYLNKGDAMFSIAEWLDSVKARASIDTDYRLGKLIGKNSSRVANWRAGRNLPDEAAISQICNLVGDDADVIAAQVQAARATTPQAKQLWLHVAKRLQAGAISAVHTVVIAIVLIATHTSDTQASALPHVQSITSSLYIMLSI
jgi:Phage related protein